MDVVNLAVGQPDFPTPEHVVDAARKALADHAFGYTPTAGTPALRSAVAEHLAPLLAHPLDADNVLISCGAKQSLHNLIQSVVDPGDEVLVPAPYWVSYPPMAQAAQAVLKVLPTRQEEGFRLQPDVLREALTPASRLLVLNSPSNPTGAAYRRADLEALFEVVLSHPRLVVLSDEIYRRLTYGGFVHTSPASLGPEAFSRSLVVDGVSKAYAMTGWRIGFSVGPPEVIAAATRYQDHTTSCASSISQAAALAAITGPQEPVEAMRAAFETRMETILDLVQKNAPGLSLLRPQGAFYAFCRIVDDRLTDDVVLAERILEKAHVAVVPGLAFGAPAHLRLSFAASLERITEGVRRIADLMKAEKTP